MRRFPTGRHFAVTWGIPDDFGGMTTALLQRSRAFVRLAGVEVDVLTFDPLLDTRAVEARLRGRGDLVDGVRLRNLYDDLREQPLPGGSLRLDRHPFTPLPAPAPGSGTRWQRRYSVDGTVLQTDHYRADGSLVLSHRRDVAREGELGGRSVVLCDELGRPVRSWGRVHHLYRAWLDRLSARQTSFVLVDSKTIAPALLPYRRSHAIVVHVVHNSHLAAGELRPTRRAVFERLDAFDDVVVLTERQRRDVRSLLGTAGHLAVVPNAAVVAPARGEPRDPRRGVVLASLTPRKRVDHAMRAVADAHATTGATLDVYGDGGLRAVLERAAAHPEGVVRMRGHLPGARAALESAGFLLATGASEGFPLVLVEAMAAGCIPIAYDVPYGPADVIDGVNGILVPDGDEAALAAAVERLLAESPAQLARRRRAARSTAARYTDAAITARWARLLRAAARRHAREFRPRREAWPSSSRPGALASLLPSPR